MKFWIKNCLPFILFVVCGIMSFVVYVVQMWKWLDISL